MWRNMNIYYARSVETTGRASLCEVNKNKYVEEENEEIRSESRKELVKNLMM